MLKVRRVSHRPGRGRRLTKTVFLRCTKAPAAGAWSAENNPPQRRYPKSFVHWRDCFCRRVRTMNSGHSAKLRGRNVGSLIVGAFALVSRRYYHRLFLGCDFLPNGQQVDRERGGKAHDSGGPRDGGNGGFRLDALQPRHLHGNHAHWESAQAAGAYIKSAAMSPPPPCHFNSAEEFNGKNRQETDSSHIYRQCAGAFSSSGT